MKKTILLLLVCTTALVAQPPQITRTVRLDRLPYTDQVNAAAAEVHSTDTDTVKNRVQAGCIELTCTLLNGNLDKEERDTARWRLHNLQRHPYFNPETYQNHGAGRFPHSDEGSY